MTDFDPTTLTKKLNAYAQDHGVGTIPDIETDEFQAAVAQTDALVLLAKAHQAGSDALLGDALLDILAGVDADFVGQAEHNERELAIGRAINLTGITAGVTDQDYHSNEFDVVRTEIAEAVSQVKSGSKQSVGKGRIFLRNWIKIIHERLCQTGSPLNLAMTGALSVGTPAVLSQLVAIIGIGSAALPVVAPIAAAIMVLGLPAFCQTYAP